MRELEIVLASQSPRRSELLDTAGYQFRISPVKVSESIEDLLNPEDFASHLATRKARACFDEHNYLKSQGFLVLGADTVVAVDDQILGKPVNADEAAAFLRLLSGRSHRVITGVTLIESDTRREWTGFDRTEVEFKSLSEREISSYVASGEPMDKAGGYGIQGGASNFVASRRGSWSNVVGLPLELLERALKENGWNVRRKTR